jgi:hypothetical protein
MIRRCFITGIAALGALLSTSACGEAGNEALGGGKRYPDYRYRLTVEVDTPEGVKSGSSVIEVSTQLSGKYSIPDPGKIYRKARGEAVTVDLGSRGVMFALLRSESDVDWANRALMSVLKDIPPAEIAAARTEDSPGHLGFDMQMRQIPTLQGRYDIARHAVFIRPVPKESDTPTAYPILVTFTKMADPKSVTKIDPDNMAARFGKGVKLKRITVERTDDAVTSGIEKRLDAIGIKKDRSLDNDYTKTLNPTLAQSLGYSDFKKEN